MKKFEELQEIKERREIEIARYCRQGRIRREEEEERNLVRKGGRQLQSQKRGHNLPGE